MVHIKKHLTDIFDKNKKYRSTGVILHHLKFNNGSQTDLFGTVEKEDKLFKIHEQIDVLEEKYGPEVVHLASTTSTIKQKSDKGSEVSKKRRKHLFL